MERERQELLRALEGFKAAAERSEIEADFVEDLDTLHERIGDFDVSGDSYDSPGRQAAVQASDERYARSATRTPKEREPSRLLDPRDKSEGPGPTPMEREMEGERRRVAERQPLAPAGVGTDQGG